MPSLAEFQRDFASALLAPSLPDGADVAPGLRVHRNTFIKGLVDALLDNYPTVAVLMGQGWLADVAREYAGQHPPRRAALADYGEHFPEFLRAMEAAHDWPYLPGVATLDRAWTESFLSADAPALAPARLAELSPEALASLRLQLHPAARCCVVAHSAVTVWQANRPPATPPAELHVDGRDEAALIIRNESGVQLLALDAGTRTFLEAITAGDGIGAAARAALERVPDGDVAGSWSTLLTLGAFADIEPHGD